MLKHEEGNILGIDITDYKKLLEDTYVEVEKIDYMMDFGSVAVMINYSKN